jgi:hypothetical protein
MKIDTYLNYFKNTTANPVPYLVGKKVVDVQVYNVDCCIPRHVQLFFYGGGTLTVATNDKYVVDETGGSSKRIYSNAGMTHWFKNYYLGATLVSAKTKSVRTHSLSLFDCEWNTALTLTFDNGYYHTVVMSNQPTLKCNIEAVR